MNADDQNQESDGQGEQLQQALKIDTAKVHSHLDSVVRQSVEQTINGLLDAEAEQLCNAGRYERSAERQDCGGPRMVDRGDSWDDAQQGALDERTKPGFHDRPIHFIQVSPAVQRVVQG